MTSRGPLNEDPHAVFDGARFPLLLEILHQIPAVGHQMRSRSAVQDLGPHLKPQLIIRMRLRVRSLKVADNEGFITFATDLAEHICNSACSAHFEADMTVSGCQHSPSRFLEQTTASSE